MKREAAGSSVCLNPEGTTQSLRLSRNSYRMLYAKGVSESLVILLNGQSRTIPGLNSPTTLESLVLALELKSDRIAVEHNGEIAPRTTWAQVEVRSGDRLEIVHFVGGGCSPGCNG